MFSNASSSAPAFLRPTTLLPHRSRSGRNEPTCQATPPPAPPAASARSKLLSLVSASGSSRIGNDRVISDLIIELEATSSPPPSAASEALLGVWRNAYTSRPDSSSPIQRFIVSNDRLAPEVEQVVIGKPGHPQAIVNRVDLRDSLGAVLNVKAVVEGVNAGRLELRFEQAWFAVRTLPAWLGRAQLGNGFRIPYPVPFRLLGDKAKGWLDITYMDSELRLSRGNRGSSFVLTRKQRVPMVIDEAYFDTWE